jgi:hemerythrin-like domain-containing protein
VTAVSRRGLLIGGAGLVVGAAATEGGNLAAGSSPPSKVLTPAEDLMREHGVLKRVLLAYRAAGERLTAGTAVPLAAVHAGATVVHDYIEGFHEGLEEGYVFPALLRAGQLTDTVDTLLVQHGRGRILTMRVLDATTATTLTATARTQLVADLAAFVRMYEPHEAREDTVVFPTLRTILSAQQLHDLSSTFATLEDQQFGAGEFDRMVAAVAALEHTLGLYDLTQFTPVIAS